LIERSIQSIEILKGSITRFLM